MPKRGYEETGFSTPIKIGEAAAAWRGCRYATVLASPGAHAARYLAHHGGKRLLQKVVQPSAFADSLLPAETILAVGGFEGMQQYVVRLREPDHARLKREPIPGYEQTGKSTSINRRGGSGAWRGCRHVAALASPGPPAACTPHIRRPSALCIRSSPNCLGRADIRSRQNHLLRQGLFSFVPMLTHLAHKTSEYKRISFPYAKRCLYKHRAASLKSVYTRGSTYRGRHRSNYGHGLNL